MGTFSSLILTIGSLYDKQLDYLRKCRESHVKNAAAPDISDVTAAFQWNTSNNSYFLKKRMMSHALTLHMRGIRPEQAPRRCVRDV